VAVIDQQIDDLRADEPGATRDQNSHGRQGMPVNWFWGTERLDVSRFVRNRSVDCVVCWK
jgi:hypothetical protein